MTYKRVTYGKAVMEDGSEVPTEMAARWKKANDLTFRELEREGIEYTSPGLFDLRKLAWAACDSQLTPEEAGMLIASRNYKQPPLGELLGALYGGTHGAE